MGFWVPVVVLLLFVYATLRIWPWILKRKRLIQMVDRIPGPTAIPILGCAYQFRPKIEDFSYELLEYARLHKDSEVVRFWLGPIPIVCAFGPESVKTVLESNKVITKGDEYDILERWLGTGLLISTGNKWRSRRKMLTMAFHFNVLNGFMDTYDKEARIFLDQIREFADTNEPFDVCPFIKRCALDIICETSMAHKIDAQVDHNHPYVNAVAQMNTLSFLYARSPWFWIKPIWRFFGHEENYERNLKLVTDFTQNVIAERRKELHTAKKTVQENKSGTEEIGGKTRRAFLDLLLSIQDEGKLTDEDIREEVDTFMFEGHDTTSSGMSWTIWCLAHHLDYQNKVIQEIDAVFGNSDRNCTNEDLKELKYLEQCIKEAMRLYPPVPLISRKVEEDFHCAGYDVPRDATILISPLVLHRDPALYENVESYNPENFSPSAIARRHAYSFIPFSAGPRNCIGQKFALMEERTVLSWFFRRYCVRSSEEFLSNIPCAKIILKPSKGVPIKIYRRNAAH
uniref:CYP4BF1 n=1 Tax=Ips paraconfusus TaxID=89938 RepID=A1BPS2_9CUCU|nr:CYP4BF1 [Ips paraconfusus]